MSGLSDTLSDSAKELSKKADMLMEAATELTKKSDMLTDAANDIRKRMPDSTHELQRDLQKMIPDGARDFAKNLPDNMDDLRKMMPGQHKRSGPSPFMLIAAFGLLAMVSFFAKKKLMAPTNGSPAY